MISIIKGIKKDTPAPEASIRDVIELWRNELDGINAERKSLQERLLALDRQEAGLRHDIVTGIEAIETEFETRSTPKRLEPLDLTQV